MNFPARLPSPRLAALLIALGLAGCSSINEKLQGDKLDYKTSGAKSVTLEVPPDLTQLTRDSRYQPVGGAISASALQAAPPIGAVAASAPTTVAPSKVGEVTLERAGSQRWLSTAQKPEDLWPQLQAFWQERGFNLELDQRETGLMETNWAENRANIPQDFIRGTIGKVFDSVWDSGQRDLYRTRLERAADGRTEIYISHRGMVEVYTNERKDSTIWQPRAPDPELEAVMLSRLMIKLGGKQEVAATVEKSAVTTSPAPAAARARLLGSVGAGLQVDDGFDRAWRRVGLALDRNGFTVEDRDRSQGQYYVRYVDPTEAAKSEPGFFAKMFGAEKNKTPAGGPVRYRIALQSQADSTVVKVLDSQGTPQAGDAAQRILELLVTELR